MKENVYCIVNSETRQVDVYRGETHIGWVRTNDENGPELTIRDHRNALQVLSFHDLNIIMDTWNYMVKEQGGWSVERCS